MAEPMSDMPKVMVLGGAPFSGKSTVSRLLANRRGIDLIHTDDLGTAVKATSVDADKGVVDPMAGDDYREYYLRRAVTTLLQEALVAHRALWPAVRAVIRARSDWGAPAIIEGWAFLPELIAEDLPADYWCGWLMVDDSLFEPRVRERACFYRGASDEERLIEQYAARSAAFNQHLQVQTAACGLSTIRPKPRKTPEQTVERVLRSARSTRMDGCDGG